MKKLATPILIVALSLWASFATIHIVLAQPKIKTVTVQVSKPIVTSEAFQKSQISYVNAIRAQHGLPALTEDTRLDTSSQQKADDLISSNYWDHTSPAGRPFYSWIYAQIPTLHVSGENLGRCYQGDEDQLFQAFVNSPEHLENIINPNFTIFGSALEWNASMKCEIFVNQFGGF